MSTKLIVKTLKPRNRFVAASFRGGAGAHRSRHRRQGALAELRRELAHLCNPRNETNTAPEPYAARASFAKPQE